MESQIEEIKQRIDIVEFIGGYIELKKSGRNFKALCPFHSEKSPSFVVSPDRQIWHCFGSCGIGGDVIEFLMKIDNLSFIEALRELADRVGIKLADSAVSDEVGKKREKIYAINNLAARYYSYVLHNTQFGLKALAYLENRGINIKIIEKFELGYAPSSWGSLIQFLLKKKYTKYDLVEAGLVVSSGGRIYDRFRNRIIFPIKNVKSNVIGFSGRLLDIHEKMAKYINTPETAVYHKRESLYGINLTRDAIRKVNNAYVVEGEFDLITPYELGIENVVAIKGSALTSEQLGLLKRYTERITLALDTDEAGIEAIKRGIREAEVFDFDIQVVQFSLGKDPDEAARRDPVAFKKDLHLAIPLYDFLFEITKKKYPNDAPFDKKKMGEEMVQYLKQIKNPIIQAHYVKKLSALLDVTSRSIERLIISSKSRIKRQSFITKQKLNEDRRDMIQKYLLSYVFQNKNWTGLVSVLHSIITPEDFSIPSLQKIIKNFYSFVETDKTHDFNAFISSLPSELGAVADEIYLFATGINEFEKEKIWDIVYELKQQSLRRKIGELSKLDEAGSESKLKSYDDALRSLNKKEIEKMLRTV